MRRRVSVVWMLAMGVACAEPEAGAQIRMVDGWSQVRDSVVVSIMSPAQEQRLDRGWAQADGGPRVPLRRLAIQVDQFMDFDCASCREVDRAVQEALRRYPVHVRNVIHAPSGSRRSLELAKAFDCAYEDGQGREMYALVVRRYAEFGTVSRDSLAAAAEVDDTVAFGECMQAPPSRRVQAGTALAKRFGLRGAPAVVIDGWYVVRPTAEALEQALSEAAARRRRGR